MSSIVSLGVWATGWAYLRATWPTEVVTISTYMTPEASSCTTWLVHIIATAGSSIASTCMCSRGTLEMVRGEGPLHRQAVTFSKPGSGATAGAGSRDSDEGESCSACPACRCSSALRCQALLASELWWWYLHFNSPGAGEVHPTVVTSQEGCNTFSQLGNQLGGTSTFDHSSCAAWDVVCPSMRAASSSGGWQDICGSGQFGLVTEEPLW